MMDDNQTTEILAALAKGDPGAVDKLIPHIQEELKAIARRHFSRERKDHTLQPTVVANEAFMRLIGQRTVDWRSRAHFLAVAAIVMRRILIDYAKKNRARKEAENNWLITTDMDTNGTTSVSSFDIEELDAAMTELARLSERQARVVELRYFGGLTVEEAAEVLQVSPRTVKGDWQAAKAWLGMRLRKSA